METTRHSMTVHPCSRISGVLKVPGDKSISHRIAMLGALAAGTTTVHGFLKSEDCLAILSVLALSLIHI